MIMVEDMNSRIALLVLCGMLPLVAQAAEIYRWVDDQGRPHFSDVVPERYKGVATKIDQKTIDPSENDRIEATVRAARQRARQAELEAARRARHRESAMEAPAAEAVSDRAPEETAGTECERQLAAYHASQACFAPYRMANGSLRAEAWEKCKDVPNPSGHCSGTRP